MVFVEKKVMTEGPVLNLPTRVMIGSIIHGGIMVLFSWRVLVSIDSSFDSGNLRHSPHFYSPIVPVIVVQNCSNQDLWLLQTGLGRD